MGKRKVPRIGGYPPESAECVTYMRAEVWYICDGCMKLSYDEFKPKDNRSITGTISSRCKCGGITSIIHHRVVQVYV